MDDTILIPWTEDQVNSLNAYQDRGHFHPFTCGNNSDHILIATQDGWVCPKCEPNLICQTWCHGFMADWSWKKSAEELETLFSDPRVRKLRAALQDIEEKE